MEAGTPRGLLSGAIALVRECECTEPQHQRAEPCAGRGRGCRELLDSIENELGTLKVILICVCNCILYSITVSKHPHPIKSERGERPPAAGCVHPVVLDVVSSVAK